MADMKFPCPKCGQHFSCAEAWIGHQLECPACHTKFVVPRIQAQAAAPPSSAPVKESPKVAEPKLAAGATQVPRSTSPAPAAAPKRTPRPPRTENWLLKYAILGVVVAALAAVGYFYGLPLLTNSLPQEPAAQTPASASTTQTGGRRGGPLGEVNDAMDVSETLDGGASAKTRPAPATNNAARRPSSTPRR